MIQILAYFIFLVVYIKGAIADAIIDANLYPVKAPRADGIGKTMSLPNEVTYLGLLTILPI
jgi:hypothetical protein